MTHIKNERIKKNILHVKESSLWTLKQFHKNNFKMCFGDSKKKIKCVDRSVL